MSLKDLTFYELSSTKLDGNIMKFNKLNNNLILITNVASFWGETDPHYKQLNKLYNLYEKKGLKILAFPCNQFADEEPGTNKEIATFCKKKRYPQFIKLNKIYLYIYTYLFYII